MRIRTVDNVLKSLIHFTQCLESRSWSRNNTVHFYPTHILLLSHSRAHIAVSLTRSNTYISSKWRHRNCIKDRKKQSYTVRKLTINYNIPSTAFNFMIYPNAIELRFLRPELVINLTEFWSLTRWYTSHYPPKCRWYRVKFMFLRTDCTYKFVNFPPRILPWCLLTFCFGNITKLTYNNHYI